jgi:hypothetical protein
MTRRIQGLNVNAIVRAGGAVDFFDSFSEVLQPLVLAREGKTGHVLKKKRSRSDIAQYPEVRVQRSRPRIVKSSRISVLPIPSL